MLGISTCFHKYLVISRRALAQEGDYEMMPVCVCVRVCVRALVSHADFSKANLSLAIRWYIV